MTIDMAIVAAEVSRMVAPRRMQSALETFQKNGNARQINQERTSSR
ncbi:MAG TPA: hypothetical protein VIA06_08340 [Candidatus Dormibacteraeota bacterium]|jgi:hypothetical protein|nr:hypothetical protein [Candidatus Dormibacteraeota bacterium]